MKGEDPSGRSESVGGVSVRESAVGTPLVPTRLGRGRIADNAAPLDSRFAGLRRVVYENAVNRGGEPFSVVVYALTTTGRRPTSALARAEAYAHDRGWRVIREVFDDYGVTNPRERHGWAGTLSLIRGAHAQGVVTVDQSAVSDVGSEYEQALLWLLDHFSFLAHVPAEWSSAADGDHPAGTPALREAAVNGGAT
jgi:hypothetical protein